MKAPPLKWNHASISPEAVEEGDEVLVDAPELLAAVVEAEGELGV